MGIWCLSLASPICGYYEEHWFITNDIGSQKVQKVNTEIEQIYIGKYHLNVYNLYIMLPCFLYLLLKQSYPQWPARWVSLFSLVARSPFHATPTGWELAMTALTIILAQAIGLCMFKPPYESKAYRFRNSTQIENGRIRLTSQSNHNHILLGRQGGRSCANGRTAFAEKFGLRWKF